MGYSGFMEEFRSKAEALQHLDFGIERGQYQNCGNLKLTEQLDFRGRTFRPYCRQHSLGVNDAYRAVASTYCPQDCHFFVSREEFQAQQEQVAHQQAVTKAKQSIVGGLAKAVQWPFNYFAKLPAVVQSLIIILAIIALFPRFKNTIIEILTAIRK